MMIINSVTRYPGQMSSDNILLNNSSGYTSPPIEIRRGGELQIQVRVGKHVNTNSFAEDITTDSPEGKFVIRTSPFLSGSGAPPLPYTRENGNEIWMPPDLGLGLGDGVFLVLDGTNVLINKWFYLKVPGKFAKIYYEFEGCASTWPPDRMGLSWVS